MAVIPQPLAWRSTFCTVILFCAQIAQPVIPVIVPGPWIRVVGPPFLPGSVSMPIGPPLRLWPFKSSIDPGFSVTAGVAAAEQSRLATTVAVSPGNTIWPQVPMSTAYAAEESMSDRMAIRMCVFLLASLLWRSGRRCQGSGAMAARAMVVLALAIVAGCRGPIQTVKALGSAASGAGQPHRRSLARRAIPSGCASRTFEAPHARRQLVTILWYPAVQGTVEDDIDWDGIFPGRGAWNATPARTPRRLPLVLLSHGSGGDASNLGWVAETLATHGYSSPRSTMRETASATSASRVATRRGAGRAT